MVSVSSAKSNTFPVGATRAIEPVKRSASGGGVLSAFTICVYYLSYIVISRKWELDFPLSGNGKVCKARL